MNQQKLRRIKMADVGAKVKEFFETLQEVDFNDIDLQDVGRLPTPVRVLGTILVFLLVCGLGYQVFVSKNRTVLKTEVAKTADLKEKYKVASRNAANLDEYKKQMETIERELTVLVSQLPNDTEVPGLLDDISDEGVGNGLDFSSIGLAKEVESDIYVELPINIKVRGDYHNIAAFISGIASLPRIVTLHDFSIKPEPNKGRLGSVLKMDLVAKTYRYNSEGQKAGKEAADKKGGKK